ncbi:MAG: hypothetical protein AMXMBFR53_06880 [Gemmatimonadota bacterium]
MPDPKKRLIVVGDRVLIQPEEGEDRTKVGLYLPATAVDNQAVQGGKVLATGPGQAVSAPTELDAEPWKIGGGEARYVPLQARVGDYAIFFRKAAVEITFEGSRALWVSNHGGRTDPSAQATVDALPEVARVAGGRVPIILDSGVRRGADVFKALALGATAVAVGRPYLWGLGAFGQAGVERALDILDRELRLTMRASGTPSVSAITPAFVGGGA